MMGKTTELEELSKDEKLLLVYPEGYKKFWNGCRKLAYSPSTIENINENLFFDKMILYFKSQYPQNKLHFFAVGISGGGHMAYKLALTMPDKIEGIAAVAANLPDSSNMGCPVPKIPVAVLIANGTMDTINPYGGGLLKFNGYNFGYVQSTGQTLRFWANLSGYTGNPVKNQYPGFNPFEDENIETFSYTDSHKPDIVLFKIIGGGHGLPQGIDIFSKAWSFFKKQIQKNAL